MPQPLRVLPSCDARYVHAAYNHRRRPLLKGPHHHHHPLLQIVSVVVPDARKAQAARDAVLGPRSTACPASVLRDHEAAVLWVDLDSSSLLRAPTKAT